MEVMQMGTLRHRKLDVSKQADRENTIKKPKTPGKFGRFARRLGLVAGIATGTIAPSLLNAQKPSPAPVDKQTQIMMAAAGESAPANTYIVPAIDGGKDARAKKDGGEKNMEPDPNQKWCDGIAIENGQLIFKGISAHGKTGSASIDISNFLRNFLIEGATTDNIKWQKTVTVDGKKIAYLVVETDRNSVLINSYPDFEKGNDTWGKAIFAMDDTKIITSIDAIHTCKDGTIIATTPTTILIIQPGKDGRVKTWTYAEIAGLAVPLLSAPVIDEENGWIRIRDPTIDDGNGNKYKILLDTKNMRAAIVELDAAPVMPAL